MDIFLQFAHNIMIITRRGYQVNKSELSEKAIKDIKQELYVTPKASEDFATDDASFSLFHSTSSNIFIPRYYGIKKYGEQELINFNSKSCNMKFTGSLREKQMSIINEIMPVIYKTHGGIITLPCGFGKTILALYIASKLNLKTLILVHKTFLQDQWINRIKEFLPSSKIGFIRQETVDTKNKDFIVGMIQSISQRKYDKKIFSDIGLIIVDECHHIASKVFSRALYKLAANYTIGLSATPTRKDGMTKVINWYLGDTLYNMSSQSNKNTIVYNLNFTSCDKLFVEKKQYMKGKMILAIPKMTTGISCIDSRNALIINTIIEISKHSIRKILILSGRINHIEYLKTQVDKILLEIKSTIKTNYYIGKSTKEERQDAENSGDILFASYSMAHEGLDIPRLNTIILATPQKDVIQSIGRIMRKTQNNCEINPLIIDICDNLSIFNAYNKVRCKLYKTNEYNITNFYINDNIVNNSIAYYNNGKCIEEKDNIKLIDIYKDIKDLSEQEHEESKNESNMSHGIKIMPVNYYFNEYTVIDDSD